LARLIALVYSGYVPPKKTTFVLFDWFKFIFLRDFYSIHL
jgi:hypothetical protein